MKGLSSLLAIGALVGADAPNIPQSHSNDPKPDDNEFVRQSKMFRQMCKPRLVYNSPTPYVRPTKAEAATRIGRRAITELV